MPWQHRFAESVTDSSKEVGANEVGKRSRDAEMPHNRKARHLAGRASVSPNGEPSRDLSVRSLESHD